MCRYLKKTTAVVNYYHHSGCLTNTCKQVWELDNCELVVSEKWITLSMMNRGRNSCGNVNCNHESGKVLILYQVITLMIDYVDHHKQESYCKDIRKMMKTFKSERLIGDDGLSERKLQRCEDDLRD